ncbi:uncharacterized protein LOC100177124 [Ciona intestinalis]
MSLEGKRFLEECFAGNLSKVKECVENGIDLNFVCLEGNEINNQLKGASGLCIAAHEGHLHVIDYLLSKGADIHHRCQKGESSLFLAARNGHASVVTRLLDAGASLVYTGNSGKKIVLENWEVFTQVLRNVYPKNINDPENCQYKLVAQHLVEHNAMSERPSILYETMFCALTVFANPIAVYSVGVYATLCPELASAVFTEENFVSALCRAFDVSRALDFVNTVHQVVLISKQRQKELCISLVKLFNWGDLLRRLAEDLPRHNDNTTHQSVALSDRLFKILELFSSNVYIRVEVLDQFRVLSHDDMARIGRLIKFLIDYNPPIGTNDVLHGKTHIWQFLFFLLKTYFRLKLDNHISRLLLKNSGSSEFEKRVLLRTLEEDASLAHQLLDFGVAVNGDCMVKSIQCGHYDLVDRFKNDRELLFCKEIDSLLKIHPSVKNSSNRNMRRCLKIVKSQRGILEDERRRFEAELLDETTVARSCKKKKQKSKTKRNISSSLSETTHPSEVEGGVEVTRMVSSDNDVSNVGVKSDKRKRKNKKKNSVKKTNNEENNGDCSKEAPEPPVTKEERKEEAIQNNISTSSGWRDLVLQESRRRRQSSSSSDCSIGARKSVHFSHPLTYYENSKPKEPISWSKMKPKYQPMFSNLKKVKTNGGIDDIRTNNFYFDDFGSDVRWKPESNRWSPRFEDLSETDRSKLRCLSWGEGEVYFCDKEKHLNIGTGPDFSNIYLGLEACGTEVSIKKINFKRASILSQKEIVTSLLSLPDHRNLNKYYSILKEKPHYYVIQQVGEYSLEQIYKNKLSTLATSVIDACLQVASGLQHLHTHGVMHMAVKPQNIMVGVDGVLRLSDYGLHKREYQSEGKTSVMTSSMCWVAQESLQSTSNISTASDIASLGMLMFYIITGGCHPFGDPCNVSSVCSSIMRGTYNLKCLPDPYSHHLIRGMLQKDPEHRININEVVSHPYFWDEEKRSKYFVALVGAAVCDGGLVEQLGKFEREIMNMYNKQEMLNVEISSIQELFNLIHDCLHYQQVFSHITCNETSTSAQVYLMQVFPGILLKTYNIFDLATLEKYQPNMEPLSKIGVEVLGDMKHGEDEILAVDIQTHDVTSEPSNGHSSLFTLLPEISGSKITRKNPTLCLRSEEQNEEEWEKKEKEQEEEIVSPSSSEDQLITEDKDWVDCHNVTSPTPAYNGWDINEGSKGHEEVKPDDWIDIGSPLINDDSPLSTSSGGSVDDCFDFGRNYRDSNDSGDSPVQSHMTNGNHGDEVTATKEVGNPLKHETFHRDVITKSTWTDIDELD